MNHHNPNLNIQPQSVGFFTTFKRAYLNNKALTLLFLGFSSGIPILLIFSSLSLWLREAGVDRSVVTMFGWAALGYSFKFIWAPLIDALPLPFLTKMLGRRRGWLLLTQVMIIIAIVGMALINPINNNTLTIMAFMAVLLGFSSASQDVVVDAYRIECADTSLQTALSATYVAGYRIGMIVAGAGALYLADFFGSTEAVYNYDAWKNTYLIMAGIMGIGVATTLVIKEPAIALNKYQQSAGHYLRLFAVFLGAIFAFIVAFLTFKTNDEFITFITNDSVFLKFLAEANRFLLSGAVAVAVGYALVRLGVVSKQVAHATWIAPVQDFFSRYGKSALLLLALIGFYRVSDIVAGVISNVFYQDMGFSKTDIANAVKLVGVIATIGGGFLGGILAQKINIMRAMMIGAVVACSTNLLFILLTYTPTLPMMYTAVIVDNLGAGFASAVFIAFLSALTSIRFTAVQYAIFSSLMTLFPKVLGGYSGTIVDAQGYPFFFTLTFLIGLPVLVLIYLTNKKVIIKANHQNPTDSIL